MVSSSLPADVKAAARELNHRTWIIALGGLLLAGLSPTCAQELLPAPRADSAGRMVQVLAPETVVETEPCDCPSCSRPPERKGWLRPLTWPKSLSAGVARIHDKLDGCPKKTPPPLGASLHALAERQIASGEAASLVLYRYDFETGAELNAAGQDRLARIVERLPRSLAPLLIEPTPGDPQLAERRREAILQALQKSSFPVPAERVLVGAPVAGGLAGLQSRSIYSTQLEFTKSRGIFVSPGAAASTPSTAGPTPSEARTGYGGSSGSSGSTASGGSGAGATN